MQGRSLAVSCGSNKMKLFKCFFTFSLESASHTCTRNMVKVDYNVVVFCINLGL